MDLKPIATAAALSLPLPALADEACFAAMRDWVDAETAAAQIEATWEFAIDRLRVDGGCYEVRARSAQGGKVEVTFDPRTLQAVSFEIDFVSTEEANRYLSLLRSGAPSGG